MTEDELVVNAKLRLRFRKDLACFLAIYLALGVTMVPKGIGRSKLSLTFLLSEKSH